MLLQMALSGSGIAAIPEFLCQAHIESNELVRVLPSWKSKTENIHILYPPAKNQPKMVKAFISMAKKLYQ